MSKRKRFRPKLRGTIRPSEMLEIKKSVKISSPKKDIGQSVYPDVKIVHSALNKVVDKDLLFINSVPQSFDKIDASIRSCMEMIGDSRHYETSYTIDQSRDNWRRARSIIDKAIGIERIPSGEDTLKEFAILSDFQKSIRDRGSFRVLANYMPANEAGHPVLVVDFIDPYHLLFPGNDGQQMFKALFSKSYTASLNDHSYDRIEKSLFID